MSNLLTSLEEEAKKHYSPLLESQLQSSRLHLNEDSNHHILFSYVQGIPTLSIEDLDVYLETTISSLEQSLALDKEFSHFHFEEQAKSVFSLIKALWGKDFSADSFFKCSTRVTFIHSLLIVSIFVMIQVILSYLRVECLSIIGSKQLRFHR